MINANKNSGVFDPRISNVTPGMTLSNHEREVLLEFFPQGLIAIDLETTGLSPLVDKIIEIAAIKISPDSTEVYSTLINPGIPIPEHTTAIHNITDEMVKEAPLLPLVLTELKNFMGDLPVVAHNAKFDLGFIVMGLQREKLTLSKAEIFCSCKFSRAVHREMINHKLGTLVTALGIPLHNHHRALDDAFASLKVFIKGLERVKSEEKKEEFKSHAFLFSLADFDEIKNEELPAHLEELNKLVKEAAVIEIKYSGGNYKNQYRPVKLTSLLNTPDGNILYARCLLSDIYKSFKLNKIQALRNPSAEDIQRWLSK